MSSASRRPLPSPIAAVKDGTIKETERRQEIVVEEMQEERS